MRVEQQPDSPTHSHHKLCPTVSGSVQVVNTVDKTAIAIDAAWDVQGEASGVFMANLQGNYINATHFGGNQTSSKFMVIFCKGPLSIHIGSMGLVYLPTFTIKKTSTKCR